MGILIAVLFVGWISFCVPIIKNCNIKIKGEDFYDSDDYPESESLLVQEYKETQTSTAPKNPNPPTPQGNSCQHSEPNPETVDFFKRMTKEKHEIKMDKMTMYAIKNKLSEKLIELSTVEKLAKSFEDEVPTQIAKRKQETINEITVLTAKYIIAKEGE